MRHLFHHLLSAAASSSEPSPLRIAFLSTRSLRLRCLTSRDYVRMNFMSFKDRDMNQERRFGEKVSSNKEDDLGTPLKLLHEGEGHRVTVELKSGDLCRGTLIESENNWTSQLEDITYIKDINPMWSGMGQKRKQKHIRKRQAFKLDLVFIRGKRVRFIILPDMLQNAHFFKLPNATTKEDKDDDLRLTLRLLHLTNYSQKMAADQGRFYL